MAEKISVLIADDHPIVRQGMVNIVEREEAFRLVGECGDGEAAFRQLREKTPQIAVLDIAMPGMNGLEIVRASRAERLPVSFVILTMYKDEEYFDEAMNLGIKGYILKDGAIGELVSGLKAVARGDYFISPQISGYLVRRNERTRALQSQVPALRDLTPSECSILRLIAENMTSREIADTLAVSYRTVQNHRSNICRKLGFKGYNRLLKFAIEHKSSLE